MCVEHRQNRARASLLVSAAVGVRSGDVRHENGALRLSTRWEEGLLIATVPGPSPRRGDQLDGAPRAQLLNPTAPRARDDGGQRQRPGGARSGCSGQVRERHAPIQRWDRGPDRPACRRRYRTRPRWPQPGLMRAQRPVWDVICKYYFRLETSGWERLPQETSLLIGNRSGGSLTMDAWTFVADWWQRFGSERVLHATAHDVLIAAPGLGDYFRQVGVIPASRQGVSAALSAGCDVIIWPGGEVDAMRNGAGAMRPSSAGARALSARRSAQACRSFPSPASAAMTQSSSCPRAAGSRTGSRTCRAKDLKEKLRGSRLPIMLGMPFGLTIESVPTHLRCQRRSAPSCSNRFTSIRTRSGSTIGHT